MITYRPESGQAAQSRRGRVAMWRTDGAGRRLALLSSRQNVTTYAAADVDARLLTGDLEYVPRHIGFIYGKTDTPGLVDPDSLSGQDIRNHPWAAIRQEVFGVSAGANIAVCPLAQPAAVSLAHGADASLYAANAAAFSATTATVTELAFAPALGFAEHIHDIVGSAGAVYAYQALLLVRIVRGSAITYIPYARWSLGAAPYPAIPDGQQLAAFWTMTFV